MNCTLQFPESSVKLDCCGQGNKQKVLIDILTRHGKMNMNELATTLGVSVKRLHYICNGYGFLVGDKADYLAQLFLMFLGRNFFQKSTLISNFI